MYDPCILVEGEDHYFTSMSGAIFEEILLWLGIHFDLIFKVTTVRLKLR